MFCALHDQLASLGRHAQLTRCFSAVAYLLVNVATIWRCQKHQYLKRWWNSTKTCVRLSYLVYLAAIRPRCLISSATGLYQRNIFQEWKRLFTFLRHLLPVFLLLLTVSSCMVLHGRPPSSNCHPGHGLYIGISCVNNNYYSWCFMTRRKRHNDVSTSISVQLELTKLTVSIRDCCCYR